MKELSIEEKAKCYDEAIERAQSLKNKWIDEDGEDVAFMIFPELKESEDERVRKTLKEYFINSFQNNGVAAICGMHIKDILAWLEKQGKNNMSISEATKQVLEDNLNKALEKETPESCNEFLEKQGEQKPADKVEPKFKVKKGEWYVCTDTFVSRGKIIAIKGQTYQSKQEDNTITCEDNCLFIDRHDGKASDYFRPWTIQDAKDGDVLLFEGFYNSIVLFQGIGINGKGRINYHCKCDLMNYSFGVQGDFACLGTIEKDAEHYHPATKEQRDLLFQKMKEAEYIFDFKNKELKKIKNDIEIPFGAKDSELQEATYFIPKGFHAEIDDDKVVIKRGKQKPAWSEEDALRLEEVICMIEANGRWVRSGDAVKLNSDWLKSLKQRIGG